ncbi:MAG: transcriptional regulator NrdR [Candidatus Pacearchaeota archaeon]|nr:transcriptional regulator NrdR [Candidatus Pacearchaeota archaeon]
MKCPYCSENTKVVDKRDSQDITRRRRECLNKKCKKRFTTYERIETNVKVIKKDKRREPFSREKLLIGINKACEKRPISQEAIEKAVNEIESKVRAYGPEIPSKVIGELVMKALKKLDKVAYVRFASVYREFQDVSDFKRTINELR